MEWTTVVFLGLAMLSLVSLMGIIIFGVKKTSETKALEKMLAQKAKLLENNSEELRKAFEESEEVKKQMIQRIQNLEAIVTSEEWEAKATDEDLGEIQVDLDDIPDETNESKKAVKTASRA